MDTNSAVNIIEINEQRLIQQANDLIATVTLEENAKATRRQSVVQFLLFCAETETTKEDAKKLFTSHNTWLKHADGTPVNEKDARKGDAGKAWNSLCSNGYSKYVMLENGVPMTYTDSATGEVSLTKPAKSPTAPSNKVGEDVTQAVEQAHAEVIQEQDNVAHWQAVFACLTQNQFDKVRADLETLGAPIDSYSK